MNRSTRRLKKEIDGLLKKKDLIEFPLYVCVFEDGVKIPLSQKHRFDIKTKLAKEAKRIGSFGDELLQSFQIMCFWDSRTKISDLADYDPERYTLAKTTLVDLLIDDRRIRASFHDDPQEPKQPVEPSKPVESVVIPSPVQQSPKEPMLVSEAREEIKPPRPTPEPKPVEPSETFSLAYHDFQQVHLGAVRLFGPPCDTSDRGLSGDQPARGLTGSNNIRLLKKR